MTPIPLLEYRGVYDKSGWGPGPWQHEPDKRQWWDAAAGLACLIVRAPVTGALCGYVGVPPEHAAYGLHYDGITDAEATAQRVAWSENTRAWSKAGGPDLGKWYEDHPLPPPPEGPVPGIGEFLAALRVHGGLTFAGAGPPIDRADFDRMRARLIEAAADAIIHPRGDSARFIAEWGPVLDIYELWAERMRQTTIGAVDATGAALELWWFGFDCGHAGDLSPRLEADLREIRRRMPWFIPEGSLRPDIYRDFGYVEGEVEALAAQFAEVVARVSAS